MKRKIFLQGKNINGEQFKIELTDNKIENLVNAPLEINRREEKMNNAINKFKKNKSFFGGKNEMRIM